MVKKSLRCAIYIRVSTAEQALAGWSLDAQRAALTVEAKKRGYNVYKVYVDDGKSARKQLRKRKAIHALLADVKAGLVDVILFKDITRWFRSVADFYTVQEVLDAAGVFWVAAEQPQLTMSTPDGRLQVNVLLSVGQNEADATSERIKYVNSYLRSNKRYTSGPQNLPLGFALDDEQHIILDGQYVLYMRHIIASMLSRGSLRAAVYEANEAYDVNISYRRVWAALKNELMYGCYKNIEGFSEAYVSKADYYRLQSALSMNIKTRTKREYVFTGLLVCGCCGRKIAGGSVKRQHSDYLIYRCNGNRVIKDCPNNKTTSESKLEALLFDAVEAAIDSKIIEVQEIKKAQALKPKPKDNNKKIDAALARLNDLYLSPVGAPMSRDEYERRFNELEAKRVTVVEADEQPQVDEQALEDLKALLEKGARAAYYSLTAVERRAFWRSIIKSITIEGYNITNIDLAL